MTAGSQSELSVVALAGGVGGARLVDGLDRALPPDALEVVVNTGDDFRHWGLHISPDLDTVMYTLAGLSPEDRGWGIEGDTFHVLGEARRRGVDEWFQLGDRDLVTHLSRSVALARGDSLTRVTANLCKMLGVKRTILPMTDAPRPTSVVTQAGEELAFQEWLVKLRAAPGVREIRYQETTEPTRDLPVQPLRVHRPDPHADRSDGGGPGHDHRRGQPHCRRPSGERPPRDDAPANCRQRTIRRSRGPALRGCPRRVRGAPWRWVRDDGSSVGDEHPDPIRRRSGRLCVRATRVRAEP